MQTAAATRPTSLAPVQGAPAGTQRRIPESQVAAGLSLRHLSGAKLLEARRGATREGGLGLLFAARAALDLVLCGPLVDGRGRGWRCAWRRKEARCGASGWWFLPVRPPLCWAAVVFSAQLAVEGEPELADVLGLAGASAPSPLKLSAVGEKKGAREPMSMQRSMPDNAHNKKVVVIVHCGIAGAAPQSSNPGTCCECGEHASITVAGARPSGHATARAKKSDAALTYWLCHLQLHV